MVDVGSAYIDYYCAINTKTNKLYIILLNNDDEALTADVKLDYTKVISDKRIEPVKATILETKQPLATSGRVDVKIPAYGIRTIQIEFHLEIVKKRWASDVSGDPPYLYLPGRLLNNAGNNLRIGFLQAAAYGNYAEPVTFFGCEILKCMTT